jgi:hypothetical protein
LYPIVNKNGTLREFQYIVMVGEAYAFADMNGTILSKEYFDSINIFTNY